MGWIWSRLYRGGGMAASWGVAISASGQQAAEAGGRLAVVSVLNRRLFAHRAFDGTDAVNRHFHDVAGQH